jgi:hypothetical protein
MVLKLAPQAVSPGLATFTPQRWLAASLNAFYLPHDPARRYSVIATAGGTWSVLVPNGGHPALWQPERDGDDDRCGRQRLVGCDRRAVIA